jgi:anti-sigma28 factor (negative regulator of flagellin synthesis)
MSRTEYHPTPHPQEHPAVQARAMHRARAVAQAAPEVRQAKVEAARRALQEGTLILDGHVLAASLLQAARTERRHVCGG